MDLTDPNPPVTRNPQQNETLRELLYIAAKIAAAGVFITLLFTFIYGAARVSGFSMAPAVKDGDLVIFYRPAKNGYLPGDAVITAQGGERTVRRVIATAGDTVDITEKGLFVNGALVQEPAIYQRTERFAEGVGFPLTVPRGHVFVLADSRAGREEQRTPDDSRIYGTVGTGDTMGKVITVIRRRGI